MTPARPFHLLAISLMTMPLLAAAESPGVGLMTIDGRLVMKAHMLVGVGR